MTKLSTIGEFGLIERVTRSFKSTIPPDITGIGDDCSVVPVSSTESLLVSTDMLIEDRHFLLNKISAFELGHKSLAVNISDIAAMGGIPEHAYLSIGIPSKIEVEWLDDFFNGLHVLARKYNMHLLGGDTTQSPDRLVINITVLGKAKKRNIKFRNTAQPGDIICVTGMLGDSAGGLKCLLQNVPDSMDCQYLKAKHHLPQPHVDEGLWLALQTGINAMMDVSDGPESDIQRIMKASGCGAIIDLEKLPVSEPLKRIGKAFNWNVLETALCGGEDYCLLFTVKANKLDEIEQLFESKFGYRPYSIGIITNETGKLSILSNGQPVHVQHHGFDHFK